MSQSAKLRLSSWTMILDHALSETKNIMNVFEGPITTTVQQQQTSTKILIRCFSKFTTFVM